MNNAPDIEAIIDRRLLLNFRVDPAIATRLVPAPFRPNLSTGFAIAGVCLIRLTQLRPHGLPRAIGITTESAAHRFAVEWDTEAGTDHGVYIPRRDTNSRLSVLLGGRVFPGEHHRCSFRANEGNGSHDLELTSVDLTTQISVKARAASSLPNGSVFRDVDDASEFFRRDTLGYSETRYPGNYDGLELRAAHWNIDPLSVDHVSSSYFADPTIFPPGTVEFDCALSMRRTPAQWRSRPQLRFAARSSVA
jgi:hypothetical protein